ncbi:hypothetical protein AZE42_09016, partial [Rhizopogon vesiculosus]
MAFARLPGRVRIHWFILRVVRDWFLRTGVVQVR